MNHVHAVNIPQMSGLHRFFLFSGRGSFNIPLQCLTLNPGSKINSMFVDLIGLFSHTLISVPIWAVHYNEEKMN